jgi:hypothetical protein
MNISPSHLVPFFVMFANNGQSYTLHCVCPLEKVSKVVVGCKAIDQGLHILKPLRRSRYNAQHLMLHMFTWSTDFTVPFVTDLFKSEIALKSAVSP